MTKMNLIYRPFKLVVLFVAGFFLLLTTACNKDDDDVQPAIPWQVEYAVSSVGDVTIDRIIYLDETGGTQIVENERDFRLLLDAESGFVARLVVEGTATAGGTVARVSATALDGSFDTVSLSDDDGEASGTPKDIRLEVELILP